MIFGSSAAFLPSISRIQLFPLRTISSCPGGIKMPTKVPNGAIQHQQQLRRSTRRRTPTRSAHTFPLSTSCSLNSPDRNSVSNKNQSTGSSQASPDLSYSSPDSESDNHTDEDFEPTIVSRTKRDQTSLSDSSGDEKPRPAKRARPVLPAVVNGTGARSFTPTEAIELRTRLLDWYLENRRELPWRTKPRYQKNAPTLPLSKPSHPSAPGAPYAVWVSEVMSQQTRIQVVVDYFQRWMKEFPTIKHLADADLDRVNELWSGLGYYRRAKFLHEGAKQVVQQYGGELPADVRSLLKIKGIGKYTAGAISSMAFGLAEPLVDGNVERVLSRLLPALSIPVGDERLPPAVYWNVATDLVRDIECAGDWNQALMEFGATHCKPRAVQCPTCPLQDMCGAFQEATVLCKEPASYVTRYPIKDPRKVTKVRDESVAVMVVRVDMDDGVRFLVMQRPTDGLLAGLWEAPNIVIKPGEDGLAEAWCDVQALLEDVMQNVPDIPKKAHLSVNIGTVTHIFSHIRQKLHVKLAVFRTSALSANLMTGTTCDNVSFRWLLQNELDSGAVPTQMRKVFAASEQKMPRATRLRK